MSVRLVNIDRDTPMLFPVAMREWLPENHLVHFVVDAVEVLNISSLRINIRYYSQPIYKPTGSNKDTLDAPRPERLVGEGS